MRAVLDLTTCSCFSWLMLLVAGEAVCRFGGSVTTSVVHPAFQFGTVFNVTNNANETTFGVEIEATINTSTASCDRAVRAWTMSRGTEALSHHALHVGDVGALPVWMEPGYCPSALTPVRVLVGDIPARSSLSVLLVWKPSSASVVVPPAMDGRDFFPVYDSFSVGNRCD
jgi:hypothetical protein